MGLTSIPQRARVAAEYFISTVSTSVRRDERAYTGVAWNVQGKLGLLGVCSGPYKIEY